METLVIKTKGRKLKALKAFLSALEIPYRIESLKTYDNKFTANIHEAEKDIRKESITSIIGKKE